VKECTSNSLTSSLSKKIADGSAPSCLSRESFGCRSSLLGHGSSGNETVRYEGLVVYHAKVAIRYSKALEPILIL
jgi:hypothetical protein